MMKKLYFTIAFIFIFKFAFSQCPGGYMVLTTQAAVDNFKIAYPSCVSANRLELTVNGDDITNLNGIGNISSIAYLYIYGTKITSLASLSNLTNAGFLYI